MELFPYRLTKRRDTPVKLNEGVYSMLKAFRDNGYETFFWNFG